jgi:myosin heavy subunit
MGLVVEKQNQSILVPCKSGSGKTETVKICMKHLQTTGRELPNSIKSTGISLSSKRIVRANPLLLEAFGNARTKDNNNSSRYGIYTKLQFHHMPTQAGQHPHVEMAGSISEVILLENPM